MEKILITEFVNHYNTLQSDTLKQKYVASVVKRKYVPILEKKALLQFMCEKSVIDKPFKSIDLVVNKVNFIMVILGLYTSIICEQDENSNPKSFEAYDLLKANGIIELLSSTIGSDIEELLSVNQETLDTWYTTNASTQSYVKELLDSASQKFGVAISFGAEKLLEALDDEAKTTTIIKVVDKALRKIK